MLATGCASGKWALQFLTLQSWTATPKCVFVLHEHKKHQSCKDSYYCSTFATLELLLSLWRISCDIRHETCLPSRLCLVVVAVATMGSFLHFATGHVQSVFFPVSRFLHALVAKTDYSTGTLTTLEL
jgi:hypothetical protein